jgi:uncharacterized membrane protein YjgN (DUF898 family)
MQRKLQVWQHPLTLQSTGTNNSTMETSMMDTNTQGEAGAQLTAPPPAAGFGGPGQGAPGGTEPSPTLADEPFTFTGSGSEYFRIWIVNLLLTVVTLGIYSAWAKVRKLKYFAQNTHVAGANFDYHGKPLDILKGRLIAAAVFVAYFGLSFVEPLLAMLVVLLWVAVVPWLIWQSLRFRLFNSSYRGIRFGMGGTKGQAYGAFLWRPLLTPFTLYLAWPWAHHRIKRFQIDNARFGDTRFGFGASVDGFYGIYLLTGVLAGVCYGLMIAALGPMIFTGEPPKDAAPTQIMLTTLSMLAGFAVIAATAGAIYVAMLQNHVWNGTRLGEHRFHSDLKPTRLLGISVTNLLLTALTLGLYLPFAQIRALKARVESVKLLPASDLHGFVAGEQLRVSATGEGVADVFDMDVGM